MADRPVVVVPTRNAAEGFAALLALDPSLDAPANAGPMTEAARAIQTLVGDRGRPRRDDRRTQGQARPDDRPRSGRRARRRRTATATRRSWRRSRRSRPGFELLTLFYGDGADLAEAEAMARRIGASVARRRGRGPPRRPAVLPVPDRSRVGVAKATSPVPRRRPTRSSCCRPRWRESGLAAGATLRRAGHQARLLHRPRPAVPPAAALRRPARDAPARRPRLGRADGDGRVGPGARRRRPRRAGLPRARRSGRSPGSRTRPGASRRRGSAAGSSSAGCAVGARSWSSRQGQALRPPADPRQPRVPGRRRGHRAAPRRPDRAGLPADRRADRDPAAGGHPRGARQGRLRLPGVPAGRDRRRGAAGRRSRGRSRRPTTRRRSRAATRRCAASPSTSCSRSSSGWSRGAASGSATRRREVAARRRGRRGGPGGARRRARRRGSAGRSS